MKFVKWAVLAVVLIVVVVGVIVYINLNSIVERTVETQTTASLDLATELDSASLSLFGGSVALDDLRIASPPGFSAPQMLALDQIAVDVDYGQLREDPVRIENVQIRGPKLVIEQAGGKFNLQALMDRPAQPTPPEGEKPLEVIIDQLTVTDAEVVLRPGLPGLAEEIVVPIPAVTLKNIGQGEGAENGAAMKEVVMRVATALADAAADSEKIPPELRQLLNLNVEQIQARVQQELTQQVGKITERLEEELPGAGKVVGEILTNPDAQKDPGKAIEEGIGNILGGRKKETAPPQEPAR